MNYIFFWGGNKTPKVSKTCFSQWYMSSFYDGETKYSCAEQYMMAQKALLFGDNEVLSRIMNAKSPRDFKSLGRLIKNFDSSIWDAHKFEIVVKGNYLKFSQNDDLKEFLLSTGDSILVEASPYDKIWGIGFSEEIASSITDTVDKWGQNLLGKAIMEVRDKLK